MIWKKEEIEFLKENYNKKIPLEEISKKLNRSRKSVQRKAQEMSLSRKWMRFNKPKSKQQKSVIDRRYYEKNKKQIYQRKMIRRKRLKEEVVNILGGKCKICSYNKCLAALEFHHTKGNKEDNIQGYIHKESRQKLLKEVNKCILLCANCHREAHHKGSVV